MTASTTTTPFTERMNELIAWAEERAEAWDRAAVNAQGQHSAIIFIALAGECRSVANHLRQLSQGAKIDEG